MSTKLYKNKAEGLISAYIIHIIWMLDAGLITSTLLTSVLSKRSARHISYGIFPTFLPFTYILFLVIFESPLNLKFCD